MLAVEELNHPTLCDYYYFSWHIFWGFMLLLLMLFWLAAKASENGGTNERSRTENYQRGFWPLTNSE